MLNEIKLIDFKSHHLTCVDLNKLNLLVGTNSGGKSSVIQGLLLIMHNISNKTASPLNGHLVSVGTFNEAANYIFNEKTFSLEVAQDEERLKLSFVAPDEGEEEPKCNFLIDSETLNAFLNYENNRIHYLSANRIGGQDLYTKNFDKYDIFGLNGEYVIDYLELHKEDKLEEELLAYSESVTLEAQVNHWLEKFSGQKIITSTIPGTDKIKAEYRLGIGRNIRPKNTGSGVSYLISILIVCLASKKGDVIVVENPEIHLHPKAQSNLMDFFIFISNSGRQLIIETHSDHMFNGAKVGISQSKISIKDVSIHFFGLGNDFVTEHVAIKINEEGHILNAVPDLFDQFTNDLKTLVGF